MLCLGYISLDINKIKYSRSKIRLGKYNYYIFYNKIYIVPFFKLI